MTVFGFSRFRRAAATTAATVLALGALAGCVSEQSMPTVAFPSATSGGQVIVPQVPITPVASYTGYAPPFNAIAVTISGIPAGAKLRYPMSWLTFSVTLANTSTFDFQGLDPLLVFGPCTCSPVNYHLAPSTVLDLWDTGSNTWKSIQSSEMDPKQLFKFTSQLGSVNLGPKASVTYKYRLELSRTTGKATGLVNGTGSLNMYVLQLPKHTRLTADRNPEATVPLSYVFG